MNLLKNTKVTRVMNSVGAGTGDTQKGTILDMQGYEGVLLLAMMGDVVNTAVGTLQAAEGTVNDTAQMHALVGSATVTATATSADNKVLALDVYRPASRYIEAQFVRATANIPIDGILAIQYGGGVHPDSVAGLLAATLLVSPSEV